MKNTQSNFKQCKEAYNKGKARRWMIAEIQAVGSIMIFWAVMMTVIFFNS